jgi:hypothetical protein
VQCEDIQRVLERIDRRIQFLEEHPTVPGAEEEYRRAVADYCFWSAKQERLRCD